LFLLQLISLSFSIPSSRAAEARPYAQSAPNDWLMSKLPTKSVCTSKYINIHVYVYTYSARVHILCSDMPPVRTGPVVIASDSTSCPETIRANRALVYQIPKYKSQQSAKPSLECRRHTIWTNHFKAHLCATHCPLSVSCRHAISNFLIDDHS